MKFDTVALGTAAVAALIALSGTALAATSGTIRLNGTVSATCSIAVTDGNQTLNLTGGENDKQVGTVVESCNSGAGYTVTVSSSNGGQLRNGNATVGYTLRYDTQSGNLNGPLAVSRDQAQFGKTVTVGVSLPANANAVAGSYSDTVTISIAAK
ncbi:spore coat protein U domain-containing protein [Arenibaculum pallidiluteum]|uniref:spore coat protein U domain-containing protein n=1 Tax=Arenibaculum pallidiluteum TaxID=2812559 RepID=UPI001A96B361|nr:spore coat protein U domain-containing protein [Arenibaculum pallidiluteum]